MSRANENRKKLKDPIIYEPVKQKRVIEWVNERMDKCGIASVPLVMWGYDTWAMVNDHTLVCKKEVAEEIDAALYSTEWEKCYQRPIHDNKYDAEITHKRIEDTLSLNEIFVFHEMSHLIRQDSHRKMYALLLLPVGVQAIASSATYYFNKMCNIKPPKTLLQATIRSSLSLAAIVPKIYAAAFGFVWYNRYCEAIADRFSCEQHAQHAKTARGLELAHDFYLKDAVRYEAFAIVELINASPDKVPSKEEILALAGYNHGLSDPEHPYPRQRAEMYKAYLEKWKKDHEKDTGE